MIKIYILTILSLFRNINYQTCIHNRIDEIATHARNSERLTGVPAPILLVIGFNETHWSCNPRSYGGWGSPISPQNRRTAGTPNQAAIALRNSYNICHSWRGAISRFRCGLCNCPPRYNSYINNSVRMIKETYDRIGITPGFEIE